MKLQENEAKRCFYPLRLDVYGSGCDHNCSYCYARAQMIVGGWNNSRNRTHPFPSVAETQCLRDLLISKPDGRPECVSGSWKALRSLIIQKLPLRIGAVTDCFQRYMEERTHTGLELLKILTAAKYPAQIVTKSDIIAENDYIEAMRENRDNLLIQFSITTASDDVSSRLEPGAPVSSKRIKALSSLVREGFFTSVRINPLFPIFPDGTLSRLSENGLHDEALMNHAETLKVSKLPIFNLSLIDTIIATFRESPPSTLGRHTLIAGFVRLPSATIKWVSDALGWPDEKLKAFFGKRFKNCYYYSTTEIGHYYEAIQDRCRRSNAPFSVCYDSEENYENFRHMWANQKDCCNALNNVPGFRKVYKDCYQQTIS